MMMIMIGDTTVERDPLTVGIIAENDQRPPVIAGIDENGLVVLMIVILGENDHPIPAVIEGIIIDP